MQNEWRDFNGGAWENEVNVRDFIQRNYKPYDGDSSFLEGATEDTTGLWQDVLELSKLEREAGGVVDMVTMIISTITSHGPAYLDKDKEKIVGFQTDKPFKRGLQVNGGIRMAMKACSDNGYEVDPEVVDFYTYNRKTHNAGVFDAYTPEIRTCRTNHIVTGLPDAYGRGRIIGDYRRMALYGIDRLIEAKKEDLRNLTGPITEARFRLGWNNRFSYKGVNLGVLFDARIGGQGVSATQALMDRWGASQDSADARENGGVWISEDQKVPDARVFYANNGNGLSMLSHYVYSMTNVRLRELTLGYDLPSRWFNDKIGMTVSLVGRNLWMLYNKAPFDPEITASTGTYYQGLDYFMQPSARTIGFSVRLQF